MDVKITFDVKETLTTLQQFSDQIPFATSKALNDTAWQVRAAEQKEMKRVFDNPTPFTLNSIRYTKATKHKLISTVSLKDFAGKGTPASKYLSAQISGGKREAKRSEIWLREKGLLAPNMFWVPGKGMIKNKYGNLTAGKITQILSVLGAFPDLLQNTTRTSRKRNKKLPNLFVIREYGKALLPGVYQRMRNGTIKTLLLFVERPTYRPRYDFIGVATNTVNKNIQRNFNKAFEYAIKTAK